MKRREGRPRLMEGVETTVVSVRLPAPMHDAMIRRAVAERSELSRLFRAALILYLKSSAPAQVGASSIH